MTTYQPFTLPEHSDEESEFEQALCGGGESDLELCRRLVPNFGSIRAAVTLLDHEEFAERYWQACDKMWTRELVTLTAARGFPTHLTGDPSASYEIWCIFNIPPGNPNYCQDNKSRLIKQLIEEMKGVGI